MIYLTEIEASRDFQTTRHFRNIHTTSSSPCGHVTSLGPCQLLQCSHPSHSMATHSWLYMSAVPMSPLKLSSHLRLALPPSLSSFCTCSVHVILFPTTFLFISMSFLHLLSVITVWSTHSSGTLFYAPVTFPSVSLSVPVYPTQPNPTQPNPTQPNPQPNPYIQTGTP